MIHSIKTKVVTRIGLHAIAVFEAAKGVLVLLAGFGIVAIIPKDSQVIAERLVRRMHLNPASHYPRIFIDAASRVTDVQLWWLAGGALVYAVFRLTEAYGLWKERTWAEWLAIISCGLYLPLEIYEIIRRITVLRVSLLLVNLAIVIFLAYALKASRGAEDRHSAQPPDD
jgi:uncharacterized membrane protein (DUF2068 family)